MSFSALTDQNTIDTILQLLPSNTRTLFWGAALAASMLFCLFGFQLRRLACAFMGALAGLFFSAGPVMELGMNHTASVLLCAVLSLVMGVLCLLFRHFGSVVFFPAGLFFFMKIIAPRQISRHLLPLALIALGFFLVSLFWDKIPFLFSTAILGAVFSGYSFDRIVFFPRLLTVILSLILIILGLLLQLSTTGLYRRCQDWFHALFPESDYAEEIQSSPGPYEPDPFDVRESPYPDESYVFYEDEDDF